MLASESHDYKFLKERNRNDAHAREPVLKAAVTRGRERIGLSLQVLVVFHRFIEVYSVFMPRGDLFILLLLHSFSMVLRSPDSQNYTLKQTQVLPF